MTARARNLLRSMTLLVGVGLASLTLSGAASAQPMHRGGHGGGGRGHVSGRPGMSHGYRGHGRNDHRFPGRGHHGGRGFPGRPGKGGFPHPGGGFGGGFGGGDDGGGWGDDGGYCGDDDC
jgi:hypothetical protein